MANDPIEKRRDLLVALGNGLPMKEDVLSKALSSGTWSDDPTLAGKRLSLLDPVGDHPTLSTTTTRFSIRAYWRRVHDRLHAHLLSLEPGVLDSTLTPESVTKEHLKRKALLETRRIRPGHFVTDFFGNAVYEIEGDPSSGQVKLKEWSSNERRLIQGMVKMLIDLNQGPVLLDMAKHLSWGDAKLISDVNAQMRAISNYTEALEFQQEPNSKDHSGKIGITDAQKGDVSQLQELIERVVSGFKEIDSFALGSRLATIDDEAVLKIKSSKPLVQLKSKDRVKLIRKHAAFESMRKTGDLEELVRLLNPDYDGPEYKLDEATGLWSFSGRDASSQESLVKAIIEKGLTSKKLAVKKSKDYSLRIESDDLTRQHDIVDWVHQRPILHLKGGVDLNNLKTHLSRGEKRLHRGLTSGSPKKGEPRWLAFAVWIAILFAGWWLTFSTQHVGGNDAMRNALIILLVSFPLAHILTNWMATLAVGNSRKMGWIVTLLVLASIPLVINAAMTKEHERLEQNGIRIEQNVKKDPSIPSTINQNGFGR